MSDMLDLSKPANFVMMRAAAEAAAMQRTRLRCEYIFLGLLKLPEVTATELDAHPDASIQQEIDAVAARLRRYGIQTREKRALLREALRDGRTFPETPDIEEQLRQFLQEAERRARKADQRTLTAEVLLDLALEQASAALRELCGIREAAPRKPDVSPAPPVSPRAAASPDRAYLVDLTGRIHKLRCHLLATVLGQTHVVHAFAEAMFNADVLAAADEQRVRPRAILVFAGPPGVGKTFFAEQAAEAMGLPFKRFDMSGYADHQQHNELVGFAASYKDAHPGTLTDFVGKNPHCVLLFDEIEKAHLNVIQLFLQVLDAGRLEDKFTEQQIPFRDAVIIFTTNAGRALYEGEGAAGSAAAYTRQTILSALEHELHPQTGRPVFPAAICSRLATGWPIVFNHLQAHDLEHIASKELQRCGGLLEKQYGIPLTFDELLPTALLFAEGGLVDARTLRAQTENFVKGELFRLCSLFNPDSFGRLMGHLKGIQFSVEHTDLSAEAAALFTPEAEAEIIVFGGDPLAQRCREALPHLHWHSVTESTEAFDLLGECDIRLVLLPPAQAPRQAMMHDTVAVFDYLPLAASVFQGARQFFQMLRARLPEVPVYLLEVNGFQIDEPLEMAFVRDGARGKVTLPLPATAEGGLAVFAEEVNRLCCRLHRQQMAGQLAAAGQVLRFDTAPLIDERQGMAVIRLRRLTLQRAVSAQDVGEVLDDARRPDIRFGDVIGAAAAKEELGFFVDYLRHPKRFAALGLKPPKGVLLYGPPGTGKTMLAKAMAGESGVTFIATAASTFVTKWQGSGPEAVRALFARARRYAPAVVFIDEIDAIGRARGQGDSGHGEEMALNALLTEMDGFATDPRRPVFVLAATNFEIDTGQRGIGAIDAALARRFDRSIRVDLPDKPVRREYLQVRLARHHGSTVTPAAVERLAGRAVGMSQADLERVIELAARLAAKAGGPLTDALLEEALELTRHGEEKAWGAGFLERVARHEAGHAMLYWQAGQTPAYLTIVARGSHGGYMEHDDEDSAAPLHTRRQMIDRLRTALGGRAAELLYYGSDEGLSTGASGDLESATRLAKAMICRYGMDETIGPVALTDAEVVQGPLAAAIAERVRTLIAEELAAAQERLRSAQPALDRLVDALLDQGRLTGEEIERVLQAT